MSRITDAEDRGYSLAENLNDDLNSDYPDTEEYRAAVEGAISFLQGVIAGLDADAKANR